MRNALAVFCMVCAACAQADTGTLAAINAERTDAGRTALRYDMQLEQAARAHAQDMAENGFFSHTGSEGSDIAARLNRVGYGWCFAAENIAAGQTSLEAVMTSWMGSRGHRTNILHRKARSVGLARTSDNHWVMVLAAPC